MKLFSDLYRYAPNGESTADPIYQGPCGPMHSGHCLTVMGTYTNKAGSAGIGGGTGDYISLCKVPAGAKLLRFYAVPSADLDAANTFTFNLGYSSVANAFASASNGLQAATAYKLDADVLINAAAAVDNDDLILTRVAGALATAGTIKFIAEFYWP